jgi:hypothetical protein
MLLLFEPYFVEKWKEVVVAVVQAFNHWQGMGH